MVINVGERFWGAGTKRKFMFSYRLLRENGEPVYFLAFSGFFSQSSGFALQIFLPLPVSSISFYYN